MLSAWYLAEFQKKIVLLIKIRDSVKSIEYIQEFTITSVSSLYFYLHWSLKLLLQYYLRFSHVYRLKIRRVYTELIAKLFLLLLFLLLRLLFDVDARIALRWPQRTNEVAWQFNGNRLKIYSAHTSSPDGSHTHTYTLTTAAGWCGQSVRDLWSRCRGWRLSRTAQTLCEVGQVGAMGEWTYAANATESCGPSWKKLFTATFWQVAAEGRREKWARTKVF